MGMLFNTLYNLSDFWFAGRLSEDALAGVSIAANVFFLLLAIGIGVQTGASAVIAPDAGRRDTQKVAEWVDQLLGLSLFLSVVILLIGLFSARFLVTFLGADGVVLDLSMEYVGITLWGASTFVLGFAGAGALMAMGNTHSNRNALAAGFLINLVLNPLLTFVLDLGVTGLALATVLIKAGASLYLFRVIATTLGRWAVPRFDLRQWLVLLRQILPAGFNMITIILGGFITVSLVGRFGSEHIAGYSVGLRLEQVLLLPALGLNAAVMALAGQNLGAGQLDRVQATYVTGLKVGLAMAAVSIPVMIYLSPAMMAFFSDDPLVQQTGATYLRIDAIAFYAYVVLFLSTATLQALQKPLFPMGLGILRQLVVPVSINVWLVVYLGFPMLSIFYTIIGVVVVAAVISHLYTWRQLRRLADTGNATLAPPS